MTRERAAELWPIIKAYGEGKSFQYRNPKTSDEWEDAGNQSLEALKCEALEYRIKPEPKMRPMTRGEVLYMVTTTPGMVVRQIEGETLYPASYFLYVHDADQYEYAKIDASGEPIDGWHKFEKECEA